MNGMCVSFTAIACALRWGVTLVGAYLYWALAHPVMGPLFTGTGSVQGDGAH